MSFVGLIRCIDGLVGFADSKSSVPIPLGGLAQDTTQGEVNKLFKTKNALIVTCGTNVIVRPQGREALEKYIHFTDEKSTGESLFDFHARLLELHSGDKYNFIIGERYRDGFSMRAYEVTASAITLTENFTGYIQTGGIEWYRKQADDIVTRINNLTIANCEAMLPDILQGMIDEADRMGGYNPVGGKLKIDSIAL